VIKRRKIDLTAGEPRDAGGYQASGPVTLAPGGRPAEPHPAAQRTETDGEPGVGEDAAVPRDSVRPTLVDVALPEPAQPEPAQPEPEPEVEEIEPAEGRLERLRGRLTRSRSAFGQGLLGILGAGDLDEDSWTEVEDTLLLADLGAATTEEIVQKLRAELAGQGARNADEARAVLRAVLIETLHPEFERAVRALPHEDGPAVVLVVGVNGTGKTTTTGKLARVLVASGRTVLLGAADTFRAGSAPRWCVARRARTPPPWPSTRSSAAWSPGWTPCWWTPPGGCTPRPG
jgi:fused signal recognition particle receptor